MKSIRIGVDMDDVLMEFNHAFYAFYNRKHGTNFDPKDQKTFTVRDLLGCTQEEEWNCVNEFYDSVDHHQTVPVVGAIEALSDLKKYDLVLISARPSRVMDSVQKWLMLHFPDCFSQVILTDQYQLGNDPRKTKGEIAKELGIQVFVEDSFSNAKEICARGIPVVLLDRYWNQGEAPEGVYRVHSWAEAQKTIESLIG